ncbi:hypothetical protein [Paraburkholderia tropica]|uniref:hypothetical protein n=1 Tax=Paraburkholderia tropica TaxID=92647 RepID=UPI002AB2B0F9|nr:hypothetical protein [Paraburkholderia tropica]
MKYPDEWGPRIKLPRAEKAPSEKSAASMPDPSLMTVRAVARMTGLAVDEVEAWASRVWPRPPIECIRTGRNGRIVRYLKTDVLRYLKTKQEERTGDL